MNRVLKVFVTGQDQKSIPNIEKIIEQYDGFVLVEATAENAEDIKKNFLIEDITDQYTIQTSERSIETSTPRFDKLGKTHAHPAFKNAKKLTSGPHHYLVQFIGPIKNQWLNQVKKVGGKIREPFGDFTYIVRADDETLKYIAALPFVKWVGHLPPKDRVSPQVFKNAGRKKDNDMSELPRTEIRPGVYTVEFFGPQDISTSIKEIQDLGFRILAKKLAARLLIVDTQNETKTTVTKQIDALAAVHGVKSIQERPFKRTSNDVSAKIMATSRAWAAGGLGLSGEGEIIAICDTGLDNGDPATIHRDFTGRVAFIKSYPITADYDAVVNNPGGDDGPSDVDSGHGTHVSGSVLGDGSASAGLTGLVGPIRGLAYKAKLVFQAVEQEMKWKDPADLQQYGRYLLTGIPLDLNTLFTDAYTKGARIHSNSWGGGEPGGYDDQCTQLDKFIWEKKDFCVVVAAGNDGTDRDRDGVIDLMSVTAPGTAKNCITVGACENKRLNFTDTYGEDWPTDYPVDPIKSDKVADNPDQIVAFSSRGPTKDNRIKPEVVSPGTYILSTRSRMVPKNNFGWGRFTPSILYMYDSGTSMATPLTAGAIALIREYLRKKKNIASPSAALLKASIIAGATRLPGTAVAGALLDNHQGFGRVNVDQIVAIPSPLQIIFTDVDSGLATGQIHQINLTVKSDNKPLRVVLAYSDYPGSRLINNLNLIVRGPNALLLAGNNTLGAPTSLDSSNNVEVISLHSVPKGDYIIQIVGANVPKGPQPFAVVYSGHV